MSIRKELAPKGITFNANDFFISDKFATILTVVSYPPTISPGYLASLISGVSGVKVVAKHIPIAFSVLAKMLNKQLADIQDRYQREKDVTVQEKQPQKITYSVTSEDLEQYQSATVYQPGNPNPFQAYNTGNANIIIGGSSENSGGTSSSGSGIQYYYGNSTSTSLK